MVVGQINVYSKLHLSKFLTAGTLQSNLIVFVWRQSLVHGTQLTEGHLYCYGRNITLLQVICEEKIYIIITPDSKIANFPLHQLALAALL